jgi:hypothetical protein
MSSFFPDSGEKFGKDNSQLAQEHNQNHRLEKIPRNKGQGADYEGS